MYLVTWLTIFNTFYATHEVSHPMPILTLTPWHYSSCRTLAASHIPLYVRFRDNEFLQGGVVSPTPNPPTWRTRVSFLVWHLPRNLSGMAGPTSSYAAAGIALEFIGAHKPPHPATKCFRQGTHFNIIFWSMPDSSEWSLPLRFSMKMLNASLMHCTRPGHVLLLV
jgi:hypothetical protein